MSGVGDLNALAHALLDAAVAALDEIPDTEPTLVGAPDRAFVHPGVPVWDCCEQLVVHSPLLRIRQQTSQATSGRQHVLGWIPLVEMVVTLTRCVPVGESRAGRYTPPSTVAVEAASAQIHADGWALHNGLRNRVAAGLIVDRCKIVEWDPVVSAAPMGGCAGWTFGARFELDGYGYGDVDGS